MTLMWLVCTWGSSRTDNLPTTPAWSRIATLVWAAPRALAPAACSKDKVHQQGVSHAAGSGSPYAWAPRLPTNLMTPLTHIDDLTNCSAWYAGCTADSTKQPPPQPSLLPVFVYLPPMATCLLFRLLTWPMKPVDGPDGSNGDSERQLASCSGCMKRAECW